MYTADLSSNRKRMLIVGPNQNQIPDGTLFNLFVNVNGSAPPGSYPLIISAIVGTNPNGGPTSVLGLAGARTVSASASITRLQPDGVLNAASLVAEPCCSRRDHLGNWAWDSPASAPTIFYDSRRRSPLWHNCPICRDRRAALRRAQPDQCHRSVRSLRENQHSIEDYCSATHYSRRLLDSRSRRPRDIRRGPKRGGPRRNPKSRFGR
jgi:hypothetical protein